MQAFFQAGGRLIDSSPMYGSSQSVIGEGLKRLKMLGHVFSADKVWVAPASRGAAQIEASRQLWGVQRFDLLQVHNLLSWQEHLPVLTDMRPPGTCATWASPRRKAAAWATSNRSCAATRSTSCR